MPSVSNLPSARERLIAQLSEELDGLDRVGLLRRLMTVGQADGPVVRIGHHQLVCWCSNDYLGLAAHPALIEAAARAAAEWGIGARASRLLAGTTSWHVRLEEALAAWFGAARALVYSSGYLANLGALGALLSAGDVVLADRLAHASLLDAARATRATFRVFRHNDLDHVADLLRRFDGVPRPRSGRRLIVTEGIFSMDGDRAPLAQLVDLAERYDAIVYVDDAHGAFVAGKSGRGSPEAAGIASDRLLYMATLGKALGCQGGFLIGPTPLIDFLTNRSRTFIYDTALAVPVAAAATAALTVLGDEPQRRVRLQERVGQLGDRLRGVATASSHIVPIVVGGSDRALRLAQRLWKRGLWAPAIRPPTVPEGTARLRVSLTTLHTTHQIDELADVLRATLHA